MSTTRLIRARRRHVIGPADQGSRRHGEAVPRPVTAALWNRRNQRNINNDNASARPHAAPHHSRRKDMSSMIEDLARDRMREIQRDTERARQIRRARSARRAARLLHR
jgi:hypothetical protein